MQQLPQNPHDLQSMKLSKNLVLRYLAQHPINYFSGAKYFPWIVENNLDNKIVIKFKSTPIVYKFMEFLEKGNISDKSEDIFSDFVQTQ